MTVSWGEGYNLFHMHQNTVQKGCLIYTCVVRGYPYCYVYAVNWSCTLTHNTHSTCTYHAVIWSCTLTQHAFYLYISCSQLELHSHTTCILPVHIMQSIGAALSHNMHSTCTYHAVNWSCTLTQHAFYLYIIQSNTSHTNACMLCSGGGWSKGYQ